MLSTLLDVLAWLAALAFVIGSGRLIARGLCLGSGPMATGRGPALPAVLVRDRGPAPPTSDDPARCPECGRGITRERDLRRPRRSWRPVAIAALGLGLAVVCAMWPSVRRNGTASITPTSVLVLIPMDAHLWFAGLPWGRSGAQTLTDELARRTHRDTLWNWQERILLGRIEGDARRRGLLWNGPQAPPPSVSPFGGAFGIHDVRDLAPDDTALDDLLDLVTGLVAADQWTTNGGDIGTIDCLAGRLVAHTALEHHRTISRLLVMLRAASAPDGPTVQLAAIRTRRTPGDPDGLELRVYPRPASVTSDDALAVLWDRLQTIEPDHWVSRGGAEGQIELFGTTIVIRTRARHFEAIEKMLTSP